MQTLLLGSVVGDSRSSAADLPPPFSRLRGPRPIRATADGAENPPARMPTTFFGPWDVRGDWTMRALEVENWLDVPFRDAWVPATGARLSLEAMTLEVGQTRVIEAAVEPDEASYRTMTWKSSDPEVATVRPRMLDDIDPKKTRPTYRTEGEIVITAIAPGTARITATTTDGSHTATCEVRVEAAD